MEFDVIREVKNNSKFELFDRGNVVSVGVGQKNFRGEPAIIVGVTQKLLPEMVSASDMVPREIDGVLTDVVEVGVIRALQDRTARWRPAPGGVSIGHYKITAGTLGCWVQVDGEWMILSNCHVLANSGDANIGDDIYQPGPYDGGTEKDWFANLQNFVPIRFDGEQPGCPTADKVVAGLNWLAEKIGSGVRLDYTRQVEPNLVDAALASPAWYDSMDRSILGIGAPTGSAIASLGDIVSKSGRTSGVTTGIISQIDATVQVQYGEDKLAVFEDQLIGTLKSQPGDSGSAVLDTENRVVGLLFAGSDVVTICNRIEHVVTALGIEAFRL